MKVDAMKVELAQSVRDLLNLIKEIADEKPDQDHQDAEIFLTAVIKMINLSAQIVDTRLSSISKDISEIKKTLKNVTRS